MNKQYDLIVIGAGPGGYVAAIEAAKLGLDVVIIEDREVGGTCLNRGCIPTKALLHAAGLYEDLKNSEQFGITAQNIGYDYKKIQSYKDDVTLKLRQGVEQLFKGNRVDLIRGKARICKDGIVKVNTFDDEQELKGKSIIIATGSVPFILPIEGINLKGVITSDEIIKLSKVPESLTIIGGGVIGVEFATVYSALGTKVTIIEALPRILDNMDKEISQNLKMILKKHGVEVFTGCSVNQIIQKGENLLCVFKEKEQEKNVTSEYILCAVGRKSNIDGLFEEEIIKTERDKVLVDEKFETSMKNVFAIGDVIPGIQLAHLASAQGKFVAELLAGHKSKINLDVVPSCVYTRPEIACIGITEEQAIQRGIQTKTAKFLTSSNGKSIITKQERGFVKIVAEADSETILGVQIMCGRATDMIGEFATVITNGIKVSEILKTMRAHPTYNESIGEALEEFYEGSINVMPKK